MTKKSQDGAPDLLALAMRRVRTEVAEGRLPEHPPDAQDDVPPELDKQPLEDIETGGGVR